MTIRDEIKKLFLRESQFGMILHEIEDMKFESITFNLNTPSLLEKWAEDELQIDIDHRAKDWDQIYFILKDGGFMEDD